MSARIVFHHRMANAVEQLALVLDGLEQVSAQLGWDPSLHMQVALVVEELAVNAASYGGRAPGEGWVDVQIEQIDGGLRIVIEDNGDPFDPFSVAEPDTALDLESRAIGGLGVHFAREMTEQQHYERDGQINRVTLFKAMPSKGGPAIKTDHAPFSLRLPR